MCIGICFNRYVFTIDSATETKSTVSLLVDISIYVLMVISVNRYVWTIDSKTKLENM